MLETRRDIPPPLIAIESVAANSPLGDLDQVWHAWLNGAAPLALRAKHPGDWQRRTSDVAQMALQTVPLEQRRRTAFILATTKGDIDAQVQWMRAADSPDSPSAARDAPCPTFASEAARIAAAAQLGGPAWAISTACSSGLVALIDAAITLHAGDAPHVLALAADEATDFVRDGFNALHALSPTTCKPFDTDRDGLTLGPAAAAAFLSANRNADAILSGWGLANDATHMTAPDRTASGLIRAIRQALAMARLAPEQIDVVLAHGTGTRYNDAMESLAITQIFDLPHRKGPAVTAVKGLIGHTLGASGLLETALAVKMLQQQTIPATTGLAHPEYPAIDFVTAPRQSTIRHILKTASGFGGLNAAVILSTPDLQTPHH